MRIAIVGGGVSGIVAAHALHNRHDITLFEAADYLGGHTNTVTVERPDGTFDIDTGFIVLNDRNYPQFTKILTAANVATQPTHMGFSVKAQDEDFEYAGTPRGVFAQRRNLLRPAFARMIADLVRFNTALRQLLLTGNRDERSLGEFVEQGGYSRWFIDRLIVPQASAVWSADPGAMWRFPVSFMAEFFANHGMLGFRDRPQWQTVAGGSHRYVEALTAAFKPGTIRLGSPVARVARHDDHVTVTPHPGPAPGNPERFDTVILACHADQALALLADPTRAEREVLNAFPYQQNEAVLHTDSSLLPRRRAARQAWNFHLFAQPRPQTTVTYYMNHLQRLNCAEDFCVSLGVSDLIDPAKVIRRIAYSHPVFTHAGIAAKSRYNELTHSGRTRYAGAYWGFGFHEDGVVSALRAVEGL